MEEELKDCVAYNSHLADINEILTVSFRVVREVSSRVSRSVLVFGEVNSRISRSQSHCIYQ